LFEHYFITILDQPSYYFFFLNWIKPRQLWPNSKLFKCYISYKLNTIDKVGLSSKGYHVSYVVWVESFWQNVWDACFTSIHFLWKTFRDLVRCIPNATTLYNSRGSGAEKGYSVVVYLRLVNHSRPSLILLLGAKTKMASLKASTIPRLELCAAVLLAR